MKCPHCGSMFKNKNGMNIHRGKDPICERASRASFDAIISGMRRRKELNYQRR